MGDQNFCISTLPEWIFQSLLLSLVLLEAYIDIGDKFPETPFASLLAPAEKWTWRPLKKTSNSGVVIIGMQV